MIAGGSEAAITPMGVGGFAAMRALSTRNDDPQHASRPFDQGPRRLRHGRGRRASSSSRSWSSRGAAARRSTPSWSATACRPTRSTSPPRPRTATAACASWQAALKHAGVAPTRGRLHQRARHLDAVQRQARDAGDQAAVRRARPQAGDLVHQVDDRPPARRRRRPRGRHHRAGGQAPGRPADDQLRVPRPRVRPRLRAQRRSATRRSSTRCRTPSASAAPTARCCSSGMRNSFQLPAPSFQLSVRSESRMSKRDLVAQLPSVRSGKLAAVKLEAT